MRGNCARACACVCGRVCACDCIIYFANKLEANHIKNVEASLNSVLPDYFEQSTCVLCVRHIKRRGAWLLRTDQRISNAAEVLLLIYKILG